MKKLSILLVLILATGFIFTSCSDDDVTGPVITILGDNPVDHLINTDYSDAGATAQDDEDGALVVEVTSDVDVDKIGTYSVEYYSEDESGNSTTASRKVNVIVKQITYKHTWAVVDSVVGVGQGIYDYFCEINSSATNDDKLLISNFGGFGNAVIVEATFDKFGHITIPSQQLIGVPAGSEGTVIGNGTTRDDGNILSIDYTITYDAGGSDNGYATFTKQ